MAGVLMALSEKAKTAYTELLFHELVPAQGCTEPAAIAYASAICREYLSEFPVKIKVSCSGNLFKNAKSVVVPNTNGMKGIAVAAICGVISGQSSLKLEILTSITQKSLPEIQHLLASDFCEIAVLNSTEKLHIIVEGSDSRGQVASVEIRHEHTHVAKITKGGATICEDTAYVAADSDISYETLLNLSGICTFACIADLSGELGDLLRRQVQYNVAICQNGMKNTWGASIGQLLTNNSASKVDVDVLSCAFAAAGSDARMSGCPLPVIINSGSGNQGITITAPVYVYAKTLQVPEEQMLRALLLGNLLSLYQKSLIGKLSAYCGAVSAGSAAGAAIAFLRGATADQVSHAFANAVACVSGILCDGAKPSCAVKIAASVYVGILAQKMALSGNNLHGGDGIVGDIPDETIRNVGKLAKDGLGDIDQLILRMMYDTLPERCK